ncbi:MAG: MlaD family protein [Ignavibacteriae bacterium]|nr:MlaD family protein [Ignavibacteriota bacterium]
MFYKKFSEIKVGLFIFIAILIVTATVFWAKGFIVGKDTRSMTVYFPAISSLNFGDPVAVNGVSKGKVTGIELEGDSVKVTFSLVRDVKIKTDYNIEIASPELMAGKTLFIRPGKEKDEIDYTKPMFGSISADISSIMKTAAEMTGDVKTLITKFNKTADNLDLVLVNMNDIIGDKRMQGDLKSTLSNLSVTSRSLNGLVVDSRKNVNTLSESADKTMKSVNNMIDESSPELKNTFKDVQSLTTKFDSLVTNLNIIVSDIHQQKSGVGKFLYDDKFFNNLNKLVEEVEKLTTKIRKDGVKINLF